MEEIELRWTERIIDKICRKHGVTPEEVEEVIYDGKPVFRRGPGSGTDRRYFVLGRTLAGRYLFIVLKKERGRVFLTPTAREMRDSFTRDIWVKADFGPGYRRS